MSHSKFTKRGRSLYIEKWNPYAKKFINTCKLCGRRGYSPGIEDEGFREDAMYRAIHCELVNTLPKLALDGLGRCEMCANAMDGNISKPEPEVFIAGCTGHINLARIKDFDEEKVREKVRKYIRKLKRNYTVKLYCGCADGADMLFAEEAESCGALLTVVLPCSIEEFSKEHSDGGEQFMRILSKAEEVLIKPNEKYRYVSVCETIVNSCRELLVLWDGVRTPLKDERGEPVNSGGTYDAICRAQEAKKKVVYF